MSLLQPGSRRSRLSQRHATRPSQERVPTQSPPTRMVPSPRCCSSRIPDQAPSQSRTYCPRVFRWRPCSPTLQAPCACRLRTPSLCSPASSLENALLAAECDAAGFILPSEVVTRDTTDLHRAGGLTQLILARHERHGQCRFNLSTCLECFSDDDEFPVSCWPWPDQGRSSTPRGRSRHPPYRILHLGGYFNRFRTLLPNTFSNCGQKVPCWSFHCPKCHVGPIFTSIACTGAPNRAHRPAGCWATARTENKGPP
jgi:hypothetical protein